MVWFIHQNYVWLLLPLMLAGIGLPMAGPALQKAVFGAVPWVMIGKNPTSIMFFACWAGRAVLSLLGLVWSVLLQFAKIFQPAIKIAGFLLS